MAGWGSGVKVGKGIQYQEGGAIQAAFVSAARSSLMVVWLLVKVWKSVVFESLWPHGLVHGILQARILEWVAVPFCRGSSQPRNWTQISRIAGGFFTSWATREALNCWYASDISWKSEASAVVQWLEIYLSMQGTPIWSLVWEDPTCHGATEPVCHNFWACTLEPMSRNLWAHVLQLLKPRSWSPCSPGKTDHCNEKPTWWEAHTRT